jgi:hypothetical protein
MEWAEPLERVASLLELHRFADNVGDGESALHLGNTS